MIDFSGISTLLFDIDNTLILFDERDFIRIYSTGIYKYFKSEINSLDKFMEIFLKSTGKMFDIESSGLSNLEKFAIDFQSKVNLPSSEIINRFITFYKKDFNRIRYSVQVDPIAKKLLILANKYFTIVAATNPLFPAIANEIRLGWGGLDNTNIKWDEVTSADHYSYTKPHLEYYYEILSKIDKKPSECMMIGDDKINDMIAGKIGIKTYHVTHQDRKFTKMIKTNLDNENPDISVNYSGSLEFFYTSLSKFVKSDLQKP